MKKSLLFLGLLGYAGSSFAQTTPNLGPWVEVNTVNPASFAPGYRVTDVKTVSPTISWIVAEDVSPNSNPTNFFVTSDPTGTQFDFGSTIPTIGSQNNQTGNISAVGVSTVVAVAATYPISGAGGEIIRTTNGGISWNKVTDASQYNAGQNGFCNFVHMFDANDGVSLGDPTGPAGATYFEILRTTDGGATWTRLPQASSPIPQTDEYGLTRSFFTRGNTIWVGTGSSVDSNPVRVLKSTDRGLTWTASANTSLVGSTTRLAFKDDLNGIAYNVKVVAGAVSEVNLIRTSDGGATWSAITPINTATGSFFRYDIDAVNGVYYSVGARFPTSTPTVAADFGSSYSTDGINWTNINNSQGFFAFDLIAGGANGTATGYAGASTDATGAGGIFKAAGVALASKNAALQTALSVYPNPSANGVFTVDLGTTLQAGAQLVVADALGRQVKSQTLNATAIGSRKLSLDLSSEKSGVYTLQIRTSAGIATQKLVVE